MPSTIKIADLSNYGNYKTHLTNDLNALPLFEKTSCRVIKAYSLAGKTLPLILVGKASDPLVSKVFNDKANAAVDAHCCRTETNHWSVTTDLLKTSLEKHGSKWVIDKATTLPTAAVAAEPPWEDAWDALQKDFVKAVSGLNPPLDALAKKVDEILTKERASADKGNYAARFKSATAALVKTQFHPALEVAYVKLALTYATMNKTVRKALVEKSKANIEASVKDLASARTVDIATAAKVELDQAMLAQRTPSRARWARFLQIASNNYITMNHGLRATVAGVQYPVHSTVSDDSISDSRPNVHGKTGAALLDELLVTGVTSVKQAHATLEYGASAADYPHLFWDGTFHPKGLPAEDADAVKAVLEQERVRARNELVSDWIDKAIAADGDIGGFENEWPPS